MYLISLGYGVGGEKAKKSLLQLESRKTDGLIEDAYGPRSLDIRKPDLCGYATSASLGTFLIPATFALPIGSPEYSVSGREFAEAGPSRQFSG